MEFVLEPPTLHISFIFVLAFPLGRFGGQQPYFVLYIENKHPFKNLFIHLNTVMSIPLEVKRQSCI